MRRPCAMTAGEVRLERRHRRARRDAGRLAVVGDGRLRPRPDDVVHRQVVAEERLGALVDVDDRGQARQVDGEEVQERAVLPEMVGVGGVVHPHLVVAEKQDDAGADVLLQPLTARAVDGGIEHRWSPRMERAGHPPGGACSLDQAAAGNLGTGTISHVQSHFRGGVRRNCHARGQRDVAKVQKLKIGASTPITGVDAGGSRWRRGRWWRTGGRRAS